MEIWAISPEPTDRLARYAAQKGIGYTFLSDGDLTVIKRWDIVNPDNPKVPHPTAIVVDEDGVIRWFRQDVDYTKRPLSSEIFAAIDGLRSDS